MTHEQKPESEAEVLKNLFAQWPDENSKEFTQAREKMIAARKAGEAPMLRHFPEAPRRRITAAELIAEAEQKPESAEFRTREAQIDGQIEDIFEAHEAEDAERVISKGDLRLMIEAAQEQGEARGAAEQRREDAVNVAALEARVKELEGSIPILNALVQACESDFTYPLTDCCADEEPVGSSAEGAMALTFGHIRRGRRLLDQLTRGTERDAAAIRKGGEHE